MAVTVLPMSTTASLVLDLGEVDGKSKARSVSIGPNLKTNASDEAIFAYGSALAGLYDEDMSRLQRTDKKEIADS